MKKSVRLTALLLLLLLPLSLVSCDRSNRVIAAFEAANWDVDVMDIDDPTDIVILKKILSEETISAFPECEVIVASKFGIPLACVLSFPSKRALRRYIKTLDEERQSAAKSEGRIRGNCYLYYAGNGSLDILADS